MSSEYIRRMLSVNNIVSFPGFASERAQGNGRIRPSGAVTPLAVAPCVSTREVVSVKSISTRESSFSRVGRDLG
jgi:hypothetical protein